MTQEQQVKEKSGEVSRSQTWSLEDDVFIKKVHARPINGKYALIKKLGQGGFGAVYLATDSSSGEQVALKLEHRSVEPSILETEAELYAEVQGCTGFPDVFWYGWHDDYKVMAFDLLGPSLEDLFEFCDRRFTLKTVLLIVDQLLQRLETLHSKQVWHRDVKPQNCLLGTGLKGNVIYMTDFGLAEYASTSEDAGNSAPRRPHLVGTARYASVRAHEGRGRYNGPLREMLRLTVTTVQSARDDLESLGYMLVYFLKGRLPWQGLKGRRGEKEALVLEKKRSIGVKELCEGLPEEVAEFMTDVYQLQHGETPRYSEMRELFRRRARKDGLDYDDIFDWTLLMYSRQSSEME